MTATYDFGKTYTAPTREEYLSLHPGLRQHIEELEERSRESGGVWDVDVVGELCRLTDNDALWSEKDIGDIASVLDQLGYRID